jgi:adenylosuccinate synthase
VHHQARRAGRPEAELKLCTGYELDGEYTDILPLGADEIERCTPIYETLEGWTESTVGVTHYDKLPVNARSYTCSASSRSPACRSTWSPPARIASTRS